MVNRQEISTYFENKNTENEIVDIYGVFLSTPIGEMLCLSACEGIIVLEFVDQQGLLKTLDKLKILYSAKWCMEPNNHIIQLKEELQAYFAGIRFEFKVPYKCIGTDFQIRVWETLMKIPYGQTISYKEQASLMNQERAIRAVASSNGKNKIAILIPCHRVIGSNGKLTGYAGGIWRKEFLLNHEKQYYQADTDMK